MLDSTQELNARKIKTSLLWVLDIILSVDVELGDRSISQVYLNKYLVTTVILLASEEERSYIW